MPTLSANDCIFRSPRGIALFSEEAQLRAMLHVESSLAAVEAELGVIPRQAAAEIAKCCNPALFDLSTLNAEARQAGNLAIPLIKKLTALVKERDAAASGYVHWGATSQDILDTALVLQLREQFRYVEELIENICAELATLAERYRDTPMPGRTWMQHAVPTTFGLQAAATLDCLIRHRDRLDQLRERMLVVQFGGAAGTLASLGNRGLSVAAALAAALHLALPLTAWHAYRDRLVEVAAFHGLLVGMVGKLARDVSLGMQTEVAELTEPVAEGRGGSSTMPHKQNPVACAAILSVAVRVPGLVGTMFSAMIQEGQRGLGGWQAEWETLPEICTLTTGAMETLLGILPGLVVSSETMFRNLAITGGLAQAEAVSMALANHVGRATAHRILEEASRQATTEQTTLGSVLHGDSEARKHLAAEEIDALLRPENYLGSAAQMTDAVLVRYRRSRSNEGRA